MRIMSLAISSPFGWRMLSEIPRLPEFLLRKLPPMSGSLTPGSGPVAASRAARPPCRRAEHRVGILAQQRRATADLPACFVAEPFAGWVGKRATKLGMLDLGEGFARLPVLVERILMRLAQRCPQQPGVLCLKP